MNKTFQKIFFTSLLIFLIKSNFYSQQLTVTSATACPGQTVSLNATWPNVGSVSYTISRPAGTSTPQTSPNFVVSDVGPTSVVYTIIGNGQALSGAVSSTTTATLTIVPAPTIAVTPANTSYCYGTTATLTAPPGAITYTVNGPGTGLFTSANNIINIPNLGTNNTGQFTVTANINGCVSKGVATVNVAPNSQVAVANQNINVCQGGVINLGATLTNGNSWSWSSSSFSSPLQNPAITPADYNNSGLYTLNATFSFVPTGSPVTASITCARTATVQVNVVQTSVITVGASPSATLCQGSNLTLAASINNVNNSYTFLWSGPQGFSSTQQNTSISNANAINSGIYTVTVLYYNASLTCPVTTTVPVLIVATADPSPVAPANVCQNGTATLSTSAPGTTTFSWTGPNSFTSNVASPTITSIQPIATGPYYVTAIFGYGCVKTKSVVITVVPVNTITVIPPPDICQPDNAHLQASAIGATSYSWSGPNGNVGYTSSTILYHPPLTATGIYTVTAGFSSGALTCYNTNTVSLTVRPLLNFALPTPSLVCYNTNIHIDGPAGATSYSWTSSSSFTANTQSIDLLNIQPSDAGLYFLTVSLNGCITSGSTSVDVITPISFSQPFFDHSICRGDTVYLEAPIVGGTGNIAYQWDPSINLSAITGSAVVGVPVGTTIYNVTAHDIVCPDYNITGSFNISVNQPPPANLTLPKTEGCAPLVQIYNASTDSNATLWITYNFGSNLKYQFLQSQINHGLVDQHIALNNPGTYTLQVTLTGTNGCSGTITYPASIIVDPTPAIEIVTDPESPTITDQVSFGISTNYNVSSYMWIFGTGATGAADTLYTSNPVRTYLNSDTYPVYVIATTDLGCSDTAFKFLQIREDFNVFIPNSFTPNNDGINDVFKLKGAGISPDNFLMELTDRKGHTLFATRDLDAGWDGSTNGSKVQEGVYVYKISVVGAHSEGKKEYIGQFSLLR